MGRVHIFSYLGFDLKMMRAALAGSFVFFYAENVATILRFLFFMYLGDSVHGSSFLVMNEEGIPFLQVRFKEQDYTFS
jgi:hypothetical protein